MQLFQRYKESVIRAAGLHQKEKHMILPTYLSFRDGPKGPATHYPTDVFQFCRSESNLESNELLGEYTLLGALCFCLNVLPSPKSRTHLSPIAEYMLISRQRDTIINCAGAEENGSPVPPHQTRLFRDRRPLIGLKCILCMGLISEPYMCGPPKNKHMYNTGRFRG